MTDFSIKRDGLSLHARLEKPSKNSDTLAIVMHGFTADLGYDESRLVPRIASALLQNDFAVLRFDFNGHGKSDGELQDMTVLNEISDAKAVLDFARTLNYAKIVLIGHSQGGVVASMLAGYYRDLISKLVLLAPAATLKTDAQLGTLQGTTYDPKNIPDVLNIRGELTVGGFYLRTAQSLPIYEVAHQFNGPVCLIHGISDKVVDYHASVRYHNGYFDSELHLLNDTDHSFTGDVAKPAIQILLEFLEK